MGLVAPLLAFILASQALAQELDDIIVGCDAVQCPVVEDEHHCKVRNDTFLDIGLTRIPDVPDSLEDFSIVQGVSIAKTRKDEDLFTSVYYLGTPQNVSLDEVHGCAVFFDPPGRKFPENTTGTCSDIIDPKCIAGIQEVAESALSYKYIDGICRDVQDALEDSDIIACRNYTGTGEGIERSVFAISLSNLTNIEAKENATSDCWPILPKSANLAPLFYAMKSWDGGPFPQSAFDEVHKITPVLTLFMAKSNSKNVVSQTVGQMSCIQIESTWTPDTSVAAPQRLVSMLAIIWAFAAWAATL
ncbi:uncharacterized protein NECHADRAFT_44279 [Fusarium vanettenii 77-13-4]|uniref:Uncharacterized protein n=1 Tax=Fusarium vanettenii (strain ATCC MYA-4622 / CBS 123669 / FGSC 9596 / NRRL 45880 / 77-13-4) TaxID=660122 RepID=C7ZAJ0_FUSV7|nr:uncharacterized protein NECHADRAFT_44279 [Fusarium vanettenii 77-13-4]EEU39282.1 hypothetical protein NECHADRAFT_44279 [Fusarium vanettenii 77-13-4]